MLEGGEEGVQFGEVGTLSGLLALDGFDDDGEFLLEGEWWLGNLDRFKLLRIDVRHADDVLAHAHQDCFALR